MPLRPTVFLASVTTRNLIRFSITYQWLWQPRRQLPSGRIDISAFYTEVQSLDFGVPRGAEDISNPQRRSQAPSINRMVIIPDSRSHCYLLSHVLLIALIHIHGPNRLISPVYCGCHIFHRISILPTVMVHKNQNEFTPSPFIFLFFLFSNYWWELPPQLDCKFYSSIRVASTENFRQPDHQVRSQKIRNAYESARTNIEEYQSQPVLDDI